MSLPVCRSIGFGLGSVAESAGPKPHLKPNRPSPRDRLVVSQPEAHESCGGIGEAAGEADREMKLGIAVGDERAEAVVGEDLDRLRVDVADDPRRSQVVGRNVTPALVALNCEE